MFKFVEVVFLLSSIIGAGILALNVGANIFGFVFFLISNVCSFYLYKKSNVSRTMFIVTFIFSIINVLGIIRA